MSFLAEIADKMPTLAQVLVFSALGACVTGCVARLHKVLIVLPGAVAAFLNIAFMQEFRAPGFCQAVVSELGYGYVVGTFVGIDVPFLIVLLLLIRSWKSDSRPARGLCTSCQYDLQGNVSGRCPECGAQARSPETRTEQHVQWPQKS